MGRHSLVQGIFLTQRSSLQVDFLPLSHLGSHSKLDQFIQSKNCKCSKKKKLLPGPYTTWGFPGSSVGKESACSSGDLGSISGSGRSPGEGNGNPLQYSCLENPMDRGAWWATVHGVAKNRTQDWATNINYLLWPANLLLSPTCSPGGAKLADMLLPQGFWLFSPSFPLHPHGTLP